MRDLVLDQWRECLGYVAALLTIVTFSFSTMIAVRIFGIGANIAFIAYGYFSNLLPPLLLHTVLLPVNIVRLAQMQKLTREVRAAAQSDLDFDWIKPFASHRRVHQGDIVFSKGERADALFLIVNGRFNLVEIGKHIGAGDIVGELGLIEPESKRTQTLRCADDGTLLVLSYQQVRQLYYQNPKFGFYLLELVSRRLFADIRRLEAEREEPVGTALSQRHCTRPV